MLEQRIEGVHSYSGKTITISFHAITNITGKQISIGLQQNFGTGGSPSATVNIAAQTITLSATMTKYTLSFVLPSIGDKTLGTDGNDYLRIMFWFVAGSAYSSYYGVPTLTIPSEGTINLAQIQLEEGSVATPFESRHIAQELALCQRYGALISGIATASGVPSFPYPVQMRTIPTLTLKTLNIGAGAVFTVIDSRSCFLSTNNSLNSGFMLFADAEL